MKCLACDEDAFEEYIDEIFGDCVIGELTFSRARILRKLDPIAFRCEMANEKCTCEVEE